MGNDWVAEHCRSAMISRSTGALVSRSAGVLVADVDPRAAHQHRRSIRRILRAAVTASAKMAILMT